MAVVQSMTLTRQLALEASTIVGGSINGSGHLILTRHDGGTIDAGNALVAVPAESLVHFLDAAGYSDSTLPIDYPDGVSLMYVNATEATADWPTFAGKWGSIETHNYVPGISADADTNQFWTRLHGSGTTPERWMRSGNAAGGWSAWKKMALSDDIAALSTNQILSTVPAETALPSTYPIGVSIFSVVAGSAWSINGSLGTVVTIKLSDTRCEQTFYSTAGGTQYTKMWVRTHHTSNGGGGWSVWARLANPNDASTMGITGEIRMWSTSTAPSGWSFCDGSTLNRTTEAALFAVVGTTFGVGDGSTTFNKPDFRGRVPVGFDSTQTEFDALGETGGEKTHVLTSAEMPSHTHTQDPHTHGIGSVNGALTDNPSGGTSYGVQNGSFYGFRSTNVTNSTTATNQNTGGGGAHNNLQPYITIRYIIKL